MVSAIVQASSKLNKCTVDIEILSHRRHEKRSADHYCNLMNRKQPGRPENSTFTGVRAAPQGHYIAVMVPRRWAAGMRERCRPTFGCNPPEPLQTGSFSTASSTARLAAVRAP